MLSKVKRLLNLITLPIMLIVCFNVFAIPGALFTITGAGGQGSLDIILCLNGQAEISCQQFHVTGGYNLTITPTIPNHSYPAIGLEMLTPGVMITNCPRFVGNRCLFAASNSSPEYLNITSINPTCHGESEACQVFSTTSTTTGLINGTTDPVIVGCQGCIIGVDCANCICNNDAGKPAVGNFKAWLSMSNINAIDNIQFNEALTYIATTNSNNIIIVPNAGIFPHALAAPINPTATLFAWTGTTFTNGTYSGHNCDDWTNPSCSQVDEGTVGIPVNKMSAWTQRVAGHPGIVPGPLYCFEIPS